MKSLLALSFFAASAIAGDWGQSCNDEIFDSSTGILTAQCNIGDGKGTFVEAKLDLYHCLKYTNGKISACRSPSSGRV
ncbi:hypothetical protein AK830_g8544 [Neonectria ditissima]|uniref:Cyanovirin-N domain-containing protein n=1 Tax=Neonectria ditissima TaxID=78410 RepID=A0A0P7B7V2_9HYPO|nr:hypothetical protein AK830_g8544 [Neonectria ditissima]